MTLGTSPAASVTNTNIGTTWDTSNAGWNTTIATPWNSVSGATNTAVFTNTTGGISVVAEGVWVSGISHTPSGTFAISGGTINLVGAAPSISVGNAAGVLTVSNALAGSASLSKTGLGRLVLAGANSHTGTSSVNAGTLAFGTNGSSSTSDITVGVTGVTNTAAMTIANAGGTRTISKSLTFSGYSSGNNSMMLNVTSNGASNSVLNFGALTVQSGFANIKASANASANQLWNFESLTINNGGMIMLNRDTAAGLGTASIASASNSVNNIVIANTNNLLNTNGSGFTVGIVAGVVGGVGGANFVTYDSTFGLRNLNTTTEQVTLTSGMSAGQNAKISGNTTLSANTTVNSLYNNNFNGSQTITFLGSTTLTVNSGMVSSVGALVIGTNANNGTLEFGDANGYLFADNSKSITVNSSIIGSGGLTIALVSVSVTNAFVALAGSNSVSGTARIIGNDTRMTARLNNSFALGNLTLDYNNYGPSLAFGSNNTAYTFGGLKGAQSLPALQVVNAGVTNGIALTVGGNNESTTYSGVLSGAGGSLIKAGTGTLTLSGLNTYTGTTTVNGGRLEVSGRLGGATYAANIINNASLVFNSTLAQNLTGEISGTGSLTQSGTSILALSASNSFTGGVIVNRGTVRLDLITATNGVLDSNNSLTLSGATLTVRGASNVASSQALGDLTLSGGHSTINFQTNGTGNPNLTLGSNWTKNAGATFSIDLTGQGGATVSSARSLTNGILNGYTFVRDVVAGVTTNGFATTNSLGNIVRYTDATVLSGTIAGSSLVATTNYQFVGPGSLTGGGTVTVNSAQITTATNGTLGAASATTMVVGAGGVLVDGNTASSSASLTGANLTLTTSIINGELQVRWMVPSGNGNSLGRVSNYVYLDGGVTKTNRVSLVKSGTGTMRMTGGAGYYAWSGDTVINEGTMNGIGTNLTGANKGNLVVNTGGTADGATAINGLSNSSAFGGTVTGTATLTLGNNNANGNFNGTISGAGMAITKTGLGTQILGGTSTYTGKTVVGGGVLDFTSTNALYNGVTASWTATNLVVSNGATLAVGVASFGDAKIQTLLTTLTSSNGAGLLGGGNFGFDSTGTSYTFTNNFADGVNGTNGLTILGGGTVILSGSNSYTGATIVNGGTLSLSNTSALGSGGITITNATLSTALLSNSTISMGGSNMTLSGGANLLIASDGSNPSFTNVGRLTISGSNNTITNSMLIDANGTNTLISFSTIITNSDSSLGYVIGSQTASLNGIKVTIGITTYALTNNANSVQLIVITRGNNIFWTGANDNQWNTNTTNWSPTNSASGVVFFPYDNVAFTNLPSATNIGVTNSGIVAGTMSISNNSNAITFAGGPITTTAMMISNNAGTITFSNASVTNTGLSVYGTNAIEINAPLTVNGGVTVDGASLTLASNSTVTDGNVYVMNGGTLSVSNSLEIANGLNASTGGLVLGNGSISGSGTVTAVFFNVTNGVISAALAGGGNLMKSGVGTVTLSASNSYSGGTTISQGALVVSNGFALGDTNGTLNIASGILNNSTNVTVGAVTMGSSILSGTGTITGTSFTATNTGSLLVSNSLTGAGAAFNQIGAGTTTLAVSNSYTGGTTLNAGQLSLVNGAALGTGTLTVAFDSTVAAAADIQVTNDIAVTSGATSTFDSGSFLFTNSGVIIGGGSLAKIGTGTFTLSGNTSYTGGTTVNSGTLVVAGLLGNGNYATNITIGTNTSFVMRNTAPQTLSGNISGAGSFVQGGSGTTFLAGSNSYTGSTIVNRGTLSLSNAAALGSGIISITNATLNTALLSNSTIALGGNTMTLSGGGTLRIASDGTRPSFSIGNLTINGSSNTITNTMLIATNGTYTLISASEISGSGLGYTIGSQTISLNGPTVTSGRTTYALTNSSNTAIKLVVGGEQWTISWTGSSNNQWNTNSTNWYATNGGGQSVTFVTSDNVLFTNLTSSTNIGVTNSGVLAGTINISDNSSAITFTGGPITTTAMMISNNAGTITFNNTAVTNAGLIVYGTNAIEMNAPLRVNGGLTVNEGSLSLASNSTVTDANVYVMTGGTLSVSNSLVIANGLNSSTGGLVLGNGTISGSGTITAAFFDVTNGVITAPLAGIGTQVLTKSGDGTVTLAASNSYTGGTVVTGGTLVIGNNRALGNTLGSLNLVSGTLSNSGFNLGVGTATLGNATISGSGTITGLSFTATNTGALLISNSLAGAGASFTQSGAGTTTLSGSNSYTRGTIVTSGTLLIGNDRSLGSTNGTLFLRGGVLSNDGYNVIIADVALGNAIIAGSGTITGTSFIATNTGSLLISNSLAGTGRFTQQGGGTTTLYGSNAYTGGTLVTNGTLVAGNTNAFGIGGVTNNGGLIDLGGKVVTNTFTLGSGTIQNGTISNNTNFTRITNGTVSADLTGAGSLVMSGSGTLILSGANSYEGDTILNSGILFAIGSFSLSTNTVTVNSGLLNLSVYRFTNTFVLNGGMIANGRISNNVIFDQLGNGTASAILVGSGTLIHGASGTLTLSGANQYSGGTLLTNGTIIALTTNALGVGSLIVSNANLVVSNNNAALISGNGITLGGGANISLTSGSSITNTGTITISGSSQNYINLSTNWNYASGATYNLISGTNISFGTTNISVYSAVFGSINYGETVNLDGTNYTFTSTFVNKVPKSLVLKCIVPVIPISTLPTIFSYNIPPAATNGGVKAISITPWGGVAAALNGNGQVVPWGPTGSSLTNWPAAAINGVTAISAGYDHLMALKNGRVYVLGGSNGENVIPPPALSGVTAISAGLWSCLALKKDGTIVAWGWKYDARYRNASKAIIFNGSTYPINNAAAAVANVNVLVQQSGDPVIGLADGSTQGMVLLKSGSIVAFGGGFSGIRGEDAGTEIPDDLNKNVGAISEGGFFAMALKKDGTVAAWGQNDKGQTSVPAGLSGVKSISAGFDYAIALRSDGTLVAWGNSTYGQTNVPAGFQGGVTAVEAGYLYSVVARPNAAGNPVDDCQSSGGLQVNGGGGGSGTVRISPVTRTTPAPRSAPPSASSSSSTTQSRTSPARVVPPSR